MSSAASPDVLDTIATTIADLLGTTPEQVRAQPTLFALPGFDSVCIVSALERLEDHWAVQVPPEHIVPEAFETLPALGELLAAAGAKDVTA